MWMDGLSTAVVTKRQDALRTTKTSEALARVVNCQIQLTNKDGSFTWSIELNSLPLPVVCSWQSAILLHQLALLRRVF